MRWVPNLPIGVHLRVEDTAALRAIPRPTPPPKQPKPLPAHCLDGVENKDETGVDCGGVHCPACPASCTDGLQNQGEPGADCGGPCAACPTCTDGVQNQGEAGVDCGGPCAACPPPPPAVPGFWVLEAVNVSDWYGLGGDPTYGTENHDVYNRGYSTSCPAGGVIPGVSGRPGLPGEPFTGDDLQEFEGTYSTSSHVFHLPETIWCLPAAPEDVASPTVLPYFAGSTLSGWVHEYQATPAMNVLADPSTLAGETWIVGTRIGVQVGATTWQILNLIFDFYPYDADGNYLDDIIFQKSAIVAAATAPDHTFFTTGGVPFPYGPQTIEDLDLRVDFYDVPAVVNPHVIPTLSGVSVDLARTSWDIYSGAVPDPETLVKSSPWAAPVAIRVTGDHLENTTSVTLNGPLQLSLDHLTIVSTRELYGWVTMPASMVSNGRFDVTVDNGVLPVTMPSALGFEVPHLECTTSPGYRFDYSPSSTWASWAYPDARFTGFQSYVAGGNYYPMPYHESYYRSVLGLSDVVTIDCLNTGRFNYPIDGTTANDGANGNPALIQGTIWGATNFLNAESVLEPVESPCFGATTTLLRPGESCRVAIDMRSAWPRHMNWNNYASVVFFSDPYGVQMELVDAYNEGTDFTVPPLPARSIDISPDKDWIADVIMADAPGGTSYSDIRLLFDDVSPQVPADSEYFRIEDIRVVGPQAGQFTVVRDPACTGDITWSSMKARGNKYCLDSLTYTAPSNMAYDTMTADNFLEVELTSPNWLPDLSTAYKAIYQYYRSSGDRTYTSTPWWMFVPEVTTTDASNGLVTRVLRVRLAAGVGPAPLPPDPECSRSVSLTSASPSAVSIRTPGQATLTLSGAFATARALTYQFLDKDGYQRCVRAGTYPEPVCAQAYSSPYWTGFLSVSAGTTSPRVTLPSAPITSRSLLLRFSLDGTCPTLTSAATIEYVRNLGEATSPGSIDPAGVFGVVYRAVDGSATSGMVEISSDSLFVHGGTLGLPDTHYLGHYGECQGVYSTGHTFSFSGPRSAPTNVYMIVYEPNPALANPPFCALGEALYYINWNPLAHSVRYPASTLGLSPPAEDVPMRIKYKAVRYSELGVASPSAYFSFAWQDSEPMPHAWSAHAEFHWDDIWSYGIGFDFSYAQQDLADRTDKHLYVDAASPGVFLTTYYDPAYTGHVGDPTFLPY